MEEEESRKQIRMGCRRHELDSEDLVPMKEEENGTIVSCQ
jgi:hypothetical protein